jgi:ParB-like chromosome segregation protein Spo0J
MTFRDTITHFHGWKPCPKRKMASMELRQVKTTKLKVWKMNPRSNAAAIHAVVKSIREFGFNAPILCDSNLNVIAGHTRLAAAKRLRMSRVPAIILSLRPPKAHAYAISDNKTASIASWDYPKLKKLLNDLRDTVDLSRMGFDESELQALLTEEKDFNWDAFDRNMLQRVSPEHKLIPIKVPLAVRESVRDRLQALAAQKGISDKDVAVMFGKVLLILLKVAP